MSGTPSTNRAAQSYTVLNLISPLDFPNKTYFYSYYCGMSYNVGGYGYETNMEEAKFEELYHKIAPYCFRKKLEDVIKDLPDKQFQKIIKQNIFKPSISIFVNLPGLHLVGIPNIEDTDIEKQLVQIIRKMKLEKLNKICTK